MPPDLTAFAKEFDIQLLTHNDPKGEIQFDLIYFFFACQFTHDEVFNFYFNWQIFKYLFFVMLIFPQNRLTKINNEWIMCLYCIHVSRNHHFLCNSCVNFHTSSSAELMSAATFQDTVKGGLPDLQNQDITDWRLEWVLRYSIIVKSRGIIKAKGYLVSARKTSP